MLQIDQEVQPSALNAGLAIDLCCMPFGLSIVNVQRTRTSDTLGYVAVQKFALHREQIKVPEDRGNELP